MDISSLLPLIALGFVIGIYGTIIGAGGGFILVPLLLFIYTDYDPQTVTGISLAVVCANAASGSFAYARQHRIDYFTGLLFAACSAPGVVLGALVIGFFPERLFAGLFGVLLLAIAVLVLRQRSMPVREPLRGRGVLVRALTVDGRRYIFAYNVWQAAALSAGIGLISSLFGIGGGVIHVPAMITLLHIPVHFAVATSHFTLAFMAGGGAIIHIVDGSLRGEQLAQAGFLALGAAPGAQVGARIGRRLHGRTILVMLAGALLVLATRLFLRGLLGI